VSAGFSTWRRPAARRGRPAASPDPQGRHPAAHALAYRRCPSCGSRRGLSPPFLDQGFGRKIAEPAPTSKRFQTRDGTCQLVAIRGTHRHETRDCLATPRNHDLLAPAGPVPAVPGDFFSPGICRPLSWCCYRLVYGASHPEFVFENSLQVARRREVDTKRLRLVAGLPVVRPIGVNLQAAAPMLIGQNRILRCHGSMKRGAWRRNSMKANDQSHPYLPQPILGCYGASRRLRTTIDLGWRTWKQGRRSRRS
jgi:hypothetical protein